MLQLSPRPLTASNADDGLFVDRHAELRKITRALKLGVSTYVAGPRGAGKTSLLHRLERQLSGETVYISAVGLEDADAVVARLVAEAESRNLVTAAETTWPPIDLLIRMSLEAMRTGGPLMGVLLDGLDEDLRHHLFGRYRDELWEASVPWVVTGLEPRLAPPEDAFFTVVVELEPLDIDLMSDLLRRRIGGPQDLDAGFVEDIAARLPTVLGPTTPRALLSAAVAVLLAEDPSRALCHLEAHETRASAMSTSERAVLDALLTLGPSHAGDDRLLAELGVTRSRAVQLLQELQRAGLVVPIRKGRRVLYDLAWRAA